METRRKDDALVLHMTYGSITVWIRKYPALFEMQDRAGRTVLFFET